MSRLSIVEMESVLATKVRTGELREQQVEIARRCLRADLKQRRLLIGPPIQASHYHAARILLARYGATEGLRTLDALQPAIALDLKESRQITLLVTADQRLRRTAVPAGCPAVTLRSPVQCQFEAYGRAVSPLPRHSRTAPQLKMWEFVPQPGWQRGPRASNAKPMARYGSQRPKPGPGLESLGRSRRGLSGWRRVQLNDWSAFVQ
ncbi:MAG: type II toxin-antitoxin system VapC family toxin [Candidatus Dormibacteraceae bacterium]